MNNIAALLMAGASAFAVTALSGFSFDPWLRKLNFGLSVSDIDQKLRTGSQNAPSMGGLMIILGFVSAVMLTAATDKLTGGSIITSGGYVAREMLTRFWSGIIMAATFGLVGFADDYIKVIGNRITGFSAVQETAIRFFVILAYLTSMFMGMQGEPYMFVPFAGMIRMDFFYWIFGIVFIYAAVKAVKITDGVDGLCAGTASVTALTLCIIAALKRMFGFSLIAAALFGACIGFLIWNRSPSRIVPGSTGSLFIAGIITASAYAAGCPLILLLCGITYVIEGVSCIVQIVYYKLSGGKTALKMAPLHRHLEICGWSQKKITVVFTLIDISGGAAAAAIMYSGGFFG